MDIVCRLCPTSTLLDTELDMFKCGQDGKTVSGAYSCSRGNNNEFLQKISSSESPIDASAPTRSKLSFGRLEK